MGPNEPATYLTYLTYARTEEHLPVHGDAPSFDEALDDAIVALRDYAEDWNERLRLAPNHAQHRDVVVLVELSDDDQLRDWLLGGALTAQRDVDGRLLPA